MRGYWTERSGLAGTFRAVFGDTLSGEWPVNAF